MAAVLFSKDHIRIVQEGNTAKLGITKEAQKKLGGILFINLPCAGDCLKIGERFGDVESTKTVSDLLSPLDGTVLSVNGEIEEEPEMLADAPDSWLVEVQVEKPADGLMDEREYLNYTEHL